MGLLTARLDVYMCAQVLAKGKGKYTMYTIHNAARVLGVSARTIREWIARDGIEITMIETDRKRIYITYNDVLALADKHRPQVGNLTERVKSAQAMIGLYSIADVARLLGVHYATAGIWVKQAKIEKKVMVTDRKRVYVSYTDIVTLAEMHNRTIVYDDPMTLQDGNAQADNPSQENGNLQEDNSSHAASDAQADSSPQDGPLYTIPDAALFLGVTEKTIRDWLSVYNIERKTLEGDNRVYISHADLIMLEIKQKRKSVHHINIIADVGEIKSRLVKIEAGILNLENYIKRSIYIGK